MKNEQLPRTNPPNSPTGVPRSTGHGGSTNMRCRSTALHRLIACVPSRPTLFTGQYPTCGVTQTDGLGKMADDSRMRWLREGEVPTLGHWFRAAGYDTHYDGKWHITHADLLDDNGEPLPTNTAKARYFTTTSTATSMRTLSTHSAFLAGLGLSRTEGCCDCGLARTR